MAGRKKSLSKIVRDDSQVKSLRFGQFSAGAKGDAQQAEVHARSIVDDATQRADTILREAQLKAQYIEQEAYQKGYQEGHHAAMVELSGSLKTIRSVAAKAVEEKWKYIKAIEGNIVELSLEIAEKVIAERIKLDPEVILNIARKALMVAAEREHIQIRVNPDDLEVLKAHKDDLTGSMDGIQKIEVIADRRVGRGGCILETSAGNVDARIQSQLSQIDQSMREIISDG